MYLSIYVGLLVYSFTLHAVVVVYMYICICLCTHLHEYVSTYFDYTKLLTS